jgi:uncharacterized protein (TIGR00369 family)
MERARSAKHRDKSAVEPPAGSHSQCLLCGERNPRSLKLRFQRGEDGAVRTKYTTHPGLQGYEGILHGGVIAALLDAAMTHCLFHQGIQGVTADLYVRYVHPVPCGIDLEIRANVVNPVPPLYRLKAEIVHEGCVLSWAEAKFVRLRRSQPCH